MVPGWAILVILVLSTLRVCGAQPPPDVQWVWGVQDEPPPLSRGKRDDGGQQPSNVTVTVTATPGDNHPATTTPSSDETDSLDPDLLLGSAPAPSTNTSLHQLLPVPTTADPMDETDSPDPDPLLGSVPAPSTNASLHRAPAMPTTADPMDETDSPEPVPPLGSVPPPSTNTSLHQLLPVPTTADPMDETDSPDPDLLLSPEAPGTQAAPQKSIATVPSWLTSPGEEGTLAGGGRDSSSMGPPSATPPALGATTAGDKAKKSGGPPVPTRSAPWDTKVGGTVTPPVPWDPSGAMGKCLLAILLLALVAATFMVCAGVLGARLWRGARAGRRRLAPTEMVCISSLLPDGQPPARRPRPPATPRHKLLLDGGLEPDGDNVTLSSFLPEHA